MTWSQERERNALCRRRRFPTRAYSSRDLAHPESLKDGERRKTAQWRLRAQAGRDRQLDSSMLRSDLGQTAIRSSTQL